MQPEILAIVIVAVVLTFTLGVTAFFVIKTTLREQDRRVITVVIQNIPFRFSCWQYNDMDTLRERLIMAVGALRQVWPTMQLYTLLDGVHVEVMASPSWVDAASGRTVAGLAIPSQKTVVVGNDFAALAHEFAHVMEAGPGRLPPPEDHRPWATNGIQAAIDSYEAQLKS